MRRKTESNTIWYHILSCISVQLQIVKLLHFRILFDLNGWKCMPFSIGCKMKSKCKLCIFSSFDYCYYHAYEGNKFFWAVWKHFYWYHHMSWDLMNARLVITLQYVSSCISTNNSSHLSVRILWTCFVVKDWRKMARLHLNSSSFVILHEW